MRRFVKHILLFFVPLLILAIGCEIVVESIPNSYSYKYNYMEHHASSIQTLILGSSYTYDGIAPSELPKAFNLANSSQTFEDDYCLLNRYLPVMDSLQTVIIAVGYGIWADRSEQYRRLYYTVYMHLYPRWPISRFSFEILNAKLLALKCIEYVESRDITRCDSLGHRTTHEVSADLHIDALVANDRINLQAQRQDLETNFRYLHRMNDLCAERGIPFVVVAMPCHEQYRASLPKDQIAMQDSILSTLPFVIDASAWPIPDSGRYDATHLTRAQSIPFTRQLADAIAEYCK